MKKSYEIDMTKGIIFPKILSFSLPLMLTGMLQLLFNSADVVVVGRFVGAKSMAAVGSTGTVVYLLVNLFLGLAMGVNVCIAQSIGAGKTKDAEEVLSTAFCAAILSGIFVFFLGNLVIRPLLTLIAIPEDVFPEAEIYLRYYFFGVPLLILYDFLAAVFRAVGDTKRPLYTQIAAGFINVLLNLFFCGGAGAWSKGRCYCNQHFRGILRDYAVIFTFKRRRSVKAEAEGASDLSEKAVSNLSAGNTGGVTGHAFFHFQPKYSVCIKFLRFHRYGRRNGCRKY